MKLMSRIARVTRWMAVAASVFLAAGAIYQFVATRLDEARYPPPGEMVPVGDRTFHLNCAGTGSPTVILEAGLGGGSLDWVLVQSEVARFTRVCSYDRSGFAWSGPAYSRERDAVSVTEDLYSMLNSAGIAPPYVMVGHSIGGIYAQMFSARYSQEVAGVVLVDSSHPDQLSHIAGIPGFLPYLLKVSAPVGITRIVNALDDVPNLTPETRVERAALYSRTASIWSMADEIAEIPPSLEQVRGTPMQLGDKPLVVLARGLTDGLSPDGAVAWRDLQSDLSRASSSGKLMVAEKSGHYIHFAEPGLVIEAIVHVLHAAPDRR